MHKIWQTLVIGSLFLTLGFSATGTLSVFADNDQAKIYVDTEQVANGLLKNYSLETGPHIVKVIIEGDTVYNKAIEIGENQKTVISSGDFDKLSAPSKPRADREASAWRDIKGNVALGLHFGSPNFGVALKWWFTERLGLQVQGWGNKTANDTSSSLGGRLLVHLTDKMVNGDRNLQQTYLALGAGSDKINGETTYKSTEFSFGFENPASDSPGRYSTFEVGYESTPGWFREEGVKVSYGYYWYF